MKIKMVNFIFKRMDLKGYFEFRRNIEKSFI